MKTKLRFIAATVTLLCSSLSVLAASDLAGWQTTRWGMTEQEATKALGAEAQRISPPEKFSKAYAPLKVPVQIGGYKLDARLQFSDSTKRLLQVVLSADTNGMEPWATLRDLLTEKYGAPAQVGKAREWRFKTTIIELDRLSISGIVEKTAIRYYPASEYKNEKSKL